jgi:hypothetical protein
MMNGNLLSIGQQQSNYIKKLYNEAVDANISNGKIIQGYIVAEQSEVNIQESTKGDKIKKLCLLSRFFHHKKCLTEMTKADILSYLNTLQKTDVNDPNHTSVGTYNGRRMVHEIFKWLYNSWPDQMIQRFIHLCKLINISLPI